MAIVSDLLQLCRLCLVKDEVNVPIFEGESDDQQISLKISSCLPVTLSQDDRLPQKICSECCRKLDTLYEFRNSSVNAEKQLVTWLEELENQSKKTSEKMSIATESLSEKTIVKEEIDEVDENGALSNEAEDYILQQQVAYDKTDLLNDAADETGEPQPKRAKRAAALKALIHTQESEEDEEDIDEPEPITKAEEESEPSETDINESVDDTFAGGPSTSADDQPGPSGVGKSTEGPFTSLLIIPKEEDQQECKPDISIYRDRVRKLLSNKQTNEDFKGSKNFGRKWICKKCPEQLFRTNKQLKEHRKTMHVQHLDDEFTFKFDDTQELFICNTCSAEFQNKEEVENHIEEMHRNIYRCFTCEETFSKPFPYALHLRSHTEDFMYKCPFCQYSASKRTDLQMHIPNAHFPKYPYHCRECGKSFRNGVQFKEHENTHLNIRPFVCIVCSKTFVYSMNLQTHQIRSHRVTIDGKLLPNQCSQCKKVYAKPVSLKNHIEMTHSENKLPREKKHLCDACGKGFVTKEKMRVHYRVHTGDKPYSCSYCPKSFTKRDYLTMHERIHSGEKPYSCEYCGKCFNQGAPLRIHLRLHTGERPYVCQICNHGFTSKGSLNMHLGTCNG